jgi:PKD repeat protein
VDLAEEAEMRIGKGNRLRKLAAVALGLGLLGLVLACSLFNQLPVARIAADVLSGTSPLRVTFNAGNSSDADGTITDYKWAFGDGKTGTGKTVTHTFRTTDPVEGFTVTLTVTDDDFATATATQTIEVLAGEDTDDGDGESGTALPTASFTATPTFGIGPLTVTFNANDSTPGNGSIAAYNWLFGDGDTGTGAVVTHVYSPDATTTYRATLYVWNTNDQMAAVQQEIAVIVPENDPDGADDPVADIFVTGPTLIYESTDPSNTPSLFEVSFDPRGSYADAGHSLTYFAWDFGDGSDPEVESSDLEVTHVYELSAPARTIAVRLTVFDNYGLEDTDVVNITLTQPEDD